MVDITITSKSDKGEKALQQHIRETKKLKIKERLIFKTAGYKQEIIKEDPTVIVLSCNNRLVKYNPMYIPMLICEIDRALKENGAIKDVDYTVITEDKKEVENE